MPTATLVRLWLYGLPGTNCLQTVHKTRRAEDYKTGCLVQCMTVEKLLTKRREEVLRIAAKHGARNVRLFGSAARGEASEGSDLDFLVEMEPERSLLDLAALRNDLIDLLGREVDGVTESSLYWLLRRKILREARRL